MFVSSGNVKSSERPRPFTLHLIAKFTDLFWRYGAQITCLPVPDCKNTSPSLWWCTSHQDAHIILWSPLLTRIASRPCNAAGVQRCIVMPGCPTAPIPFKALPSGWHQLGCCSKRCPFFFSNQVWALYRSQQGSWSLKPISYHFAKLDKIVLSLCSLFVWLLLCALHLSADFFHPPTFFPST